MKMDDNKGKNQKEESEEPKQNGKTKNLAMVTSTIILGGSAAVLLVEGCLGTTTMDRDDRAIPEMAEDAAPEGDLNELPDADVEEDTIQDGETDGGLDADREIDDELLEDGDPDGCEPQIQGCPALEGVHNIRTLEGIGSREEIGDIILELADFVPGDAELGESEDRIYAVLLVFDKCGEPVIDENTEEQKSVRVNTEATDEVTYEEVTYVCTPLTCTAEDELVEMDVEGYCGEPQEDADITPADGDGDFDVDYDEDLDIINDADEGDQDEVDADEVDRDEENDADEQLDADEEFDIDIDTDVESDLDGADTDLESSDSDFEEAGSDVDIDLDVDTDGSTVTCENVREGTRSGILLMGVETRVGGYGFEYIGQATEGGVNGIHVQIRCRDGTQLFPDPVFVEDGGNVNFDVSGNTMNISITNNYSTDRVANCDIAVSRN